MKFYLFLISYLFIFLNIIVSQNCDIYIPQSEGSIFEISNFNEKGKLTSKLFYEILEKSTSESVVIWTIKSKFFNSKNKEQSNNTFTYKCSKGVFYMDMKSLIPAENRSLTGSDFNLNFEGEDIAFPNNLGIGQTLPDARVKMKVLSGTTPIMTIEVLLVNRKVEGIEKITTMAGDFNCYKISYDTELNALFNMKSRNISWFAKDIGLVKSESYDKKGELTGKSELSMLSVK